jgi:hypothetical protein
VKQGSNALPSYLVLRDEFYAADRHAYAIRYHFSPGVSAAIRDHSIDAQVSAGKKLELHVGTSSSARMRIEEGWVSRAYAQRESAPVAVVQAEGTGYQEALSLLIPRDDQRYRVETRPQSALIIGEEGSFDVILTGDGSSVREADRLSSSGRLAFGRFTAAKPTLLLLIDGAMIEARGRVAFRSPACADYSLIKLDDNEIELKLEGPGEFDLFISEPVRAVTINYSRVEVSGDARQLRFVCADGLWRAW